jgi:hypothetical protein
VKKLISIGVALALLAMVVLPVGVTAYTNPVTYAKVPFAIIASGLEMVGALLDELGPTLGLPTYINSNVTKIIADWTYGPLSWVVDMLSWGFWLGGAVLSSMDSLLTSMNVALPFAMGDVAVILDTIACGLLVCWSTTNCTGNFTPCVGLNLTP